MIELAPGIEQEQEESKKLSGWMMKQRTTHIIKSYNQESDRGFVLIMAADLDDALEQLHRTCIEESVNPKPKAKLVDGLFGKFGPLSTFASRNLLAYAYGLIDKSVFDDLERLRKVRNLVAHSIADISLVDVYDVVNSMGSMKRTAAKFNQTAAIVEKSARGIRQHLFQTWTNLWIELADAEARFAQRWRRRARTKLKPPSPSNAIDVGSGTSAMI